MKKLIAALLLASLLLAGCASPAPEMYQLTYLDVFDTVTTIRGFETDAAVFQENAAAVHEALMEYHRLFDIYHTYDGISNLKTINDNAGIAPVSVDRRIIDLLLDCRSYYELTGGKMNAAMGSILQLWHEKRAAAEADPQHAALPDPKLLTEAAEHCSFDTVVIDPDAGTVFIADPMQRLDVGAVAKGWTAQQVSRLLPEGYLIDLGCNICITGPKPGGQAWNVGVQNPDSTRDYLCVLSISQGSTVTSGDYHRYYEVDGQRYHHIIDPGTLQPSAYWRSVSILSSDSGLADALSTALFVMDYEHGLALLEKTGCEAMWMAPDGTQLYSAHFTDSVRP